MKSLQFDVPRKQKTAREMLARARQKSGGNNNTKGKQNSTEKHVKFTCNICGQVKRDWTSLRYHFRTHTGERPYVCRGCSKDFCRPDHLKNHIRSVHSPGQYQELIELMERDKREIKLKLKELKANYREAYRCKGTYDEQSECNEQLDSFTE